MIIQTEIEFSTCILKVAIMARDTTYASVLLIRLHPNPLSVIPILIFITFDGFFMPAQTVSNDLLASHR